MKPTDWIRIFAVLSGAIAQIALSALPFIQGWEHTIGSRSGDYSTLITPAGYAFSIWGLLYFGSILFALYHAFRPKNALLRRLGWFAAAAYWGNAVWALYVPVFAFDLFSTALIFIIWINLVMAMETARAARLSGGETGMAGRLALIPLHALGGWLNAAAFVNIAVTAQFYDLPWLGSGEIAPAVLILTGAALSAALITARTGSVSYIAASCWGFYAVYAADQARGDSLISWLSLGAIALGVAALAGGWVRRRGRA